MVRILFSRWCPVTWSEAEFYLSNEDVIIISYGELKTMPSEVVSEKGLRYSPVVENEEIVGFNAI